VILDTNALSAWADGNPNCRNALATASRLVIPVVVLGEFDFGIRQSVQRARYEAWLATYLPMTEIAILSAVTAAAYAGLRLDLKTRGTPIPANDAWIAALTLQLALPLLSNDTHFDVVPDLLRIAF
jgi:tRNA(fMet)-specific endonuclease VapC